MSMPLRPKLFTTTLVTSSSTPGRILGRPSRIVTLVPRSAIIEANSQPMAPPPITTAVGGSLGRSSISSDVTTMVPSTSKPGIVRGTEPAARITASAVSSVVEPSAAVTVTLRSAPRVPVPAWVVTFRFFSVPWRPFQLAWTIVFLRARDTSQSSPVTSARMPYSLACCTWRLVAAVSSSSLAGMHPRCRHVPPTLSFSTRPTFSPADPA
jgi:hypothetical protein